MSDLQTAIQKLDSELQGVIDSMLADAPDGIDISDWYSEHMDFGPEKKNNLLVLKCAYHGMCCARLFEAAKRTGTSEGAQISAGQPRGCTRFWS